MGRVWSTARGSGKGSATGWAPGLAGYGAVNSFGVGATRSHPRAFRTDVGFGGRDAEHVTVVQSIGALSNRGSEVFEARTPSDTEPSLVDTIGLSLVLDVGYTNPETGYLVGEQTGQILRTDDGGQTWLPYGVTTLE